MLLVGLAGGLFRVLPAVDRAMVEVVGFMTVDVLEAETEGFVAVNGRLGGMPVLTGGGLCLLSDSDILDPRFSLSAANAGKGSISSVAIMCERSTTFPQY